MMEESLPKQRVEPSPCAYWCRGDPTEQQPTEAKEQLQQQVGEHQRAAPQPTERQAEKKEPQLRNSGRGQQIQLSKRGNKEGRQQREEKPQSLGEPVALARVAVSSPNCYLPSQTTSQQSRVECMQEHLLLHARAIGEGLSARRKVLHGKVAVGMSSLVEAISAAAHPAVVADAPPQAAGVSFVLATPAQPRNSDLFLAAACRAGAPALTAPVFAAAASFSAAAASSPAAAVAPPTAAAAASLTAADSLVTPPSALLSRHLPLMLQCSAAVASSFFAKPIRCITAFALQLPLLLLLVTSAVLLSTIMQVHALSHQRFFEKLPLHGQLVLRSQRAASASSGHCLLYNCRNFAPLLNSSISVSPPATHTPAARNQSPIDAVAVSAPASSATVSLAPLGLATLSAQEVAAVQGGAATAQASSSTTFITAAAERRPAAAAHSNVLAASRKRTGAVFPQRVATGVSAARPTMLCENAVATRTLTPIGFAPFSAQLQQQQPKTSSAADTPLSLAASYCRPAAFSAAVPTADVSITATAARPAARFSLSFAANELLPSPAAAAGATTALAASSSFSKTSRRRQSASLFAFQNSLPGPAAGGSPFVSAAVQTPAAAVATSPVLSYGRSERASPTAAGAPTPAAAATAGGEGLARQSAYTRTMPAAAAAGGSLRPADYGGSGGGTGGRPRHWEASLNRVTLIGRLGAEPEIRQMSNGEKYAWFSMATSSHWVDKATGDLQARTEWHRVVVYDESLVDLVDNYLHTGRRVFVEGKLQTRRWAGGDGAERYTTSVVVSRYQGDLILLDQPAAAAAAPAVTESARSPSQSRDEGGSLPAD